MKVEKFVELLGAEFYTGVPDSLLSALGNYLIKKYGISKQHIIAANEGNAVALAAGYHLSTGKIPVVYMQNSGIGNVVNPTASLLNEEVYAIPCIFVVGWRGEPGVHDEPQHIFQGKVTQKLLEDIGLETSVISADTTENEVAEKMAEYQKVLEQGKSVAFIVRKNALVYEEPVKYNNENTLNREETLAKIVEIAKEDLMVSTTGKISRELFEIREKNKQGHEKDFLTVGSMGHCSSIALSIALNKSTERVWCVDGDGAVLMHMGAMAVIGNMKPANLVHVVLNNGAHESVGGLPTVADTADLAGVAKECGYTNIFSVRTESELEETLQKLKNIDGLTFVEIKVALGSRKDLGRPTTTAIENKRDFMEYIKSK